jgi:hypothetical protein
MTDEEIKQWKQKFNELLLRHCKAIAYLDNLAIGQAKREAWIPQYQDILKELDYIVSLFDTDGVKYTNFEIWGGFEIGN